ncbi:hypothetical protein HHK36_006351 [Tetracentron sinense]|uniref:Uncharacterized protein n=1 Tax=Tetracentron sinense TaxID=13715 RepID=A0A835DP45_TETSI|nr:hypothetical protein HHK36_006351 [Tetracentron sinense]
MEDSCTCVWKKLILFFEIATVVASFIISFLMFLWTGQSFCHRYAASSMLLRDLAKHDSSSLKLHDFASLESFTSIWLGNLQNLSFIILKYCGRNDPDLNKEMEKQLVDLLTEELKLHEAVAEEHIHHMNVTFAEARRVASQYQKEAEKCNAATETCEEAREGSEALLTKERKVTSLWERRARQLGWEGE